MLLPLSIREISFSKDFNLIISSSESNYFKMNKTSASKIYIFLSQLRNDRNYICNVYISSNNLLFDLYNDFSCDPFLVNIDSNPLLISNLISKKVYKTVNNLYNTSILIQYREIIKLEN